MKVTWIPRDFLPLQGALGLTHSPGSEDSGRDCELRFLAELGVDHIFCLQEDDEFWRYVPPENLSIRRGVVEALGMAFSSYPIEDFKAPEIELAKHMVDAIVAELRLGKTVIVHCLAGLGRAGTLAACVLIDAGMKGDSALQLIRWLRPGAVQSVEQEALIAELSAEQNAA